MRQRVTNISRTEPAGRADAGVDRLNALHAAQEGPLRAYLHKMGVNTTEIDDVIQETWARLLRRPDQLIGVRSPRAWLFTVALNVFRDRIREQKKHDLLDDTDESLRPAPLESPESSVIDSESLKRVQQAITNLPEQTRQIFTLSRFEELTYPEIAQQLGISTRTVERHVARAMLILRQQYVRE